MKGNKLIGSKKKEAPSIEVELRQTQLQLETAFDTSKKRYVEFFNIYSAWEMRARQAALICAVDDNSSMDTVNTLAQRADEFAELYGQKANREKEHLEKINENYQMISTVLADLKSVKALQILRSSHHFETNGHDDAANQTSRHQVEKLIHTAKALIELKTEA